MHTHIHALTYTHTHTITRANTLTDTHVLPHYTVTCTDSYVHSHTPAHSQTQPHTFSNKFAKGQLPHACSHSFTPPTHSFLHTRTFFCVLTPTHTLTHTQFRICCRLPRACCCGLCGIGERSHSRQTPAAPSPASAWAVPGGIFPLALLGFPRTGTCWGAHSGGSSEVSVSNAPRKLFTSCKNKCDFHLIWVITFAVN